MRNIVARIMSLNSRGRRFSIAKDVTTRDIVALVARLSMSSVRGFLRRPFLGSAGGLLLVGTGVRFLHSSHIYFGRNCIVEEGVEIVGLSAGGIQIGDNVTIGRGALIKPTGYYCQDPGAGVVIGDSSNVGAFSYVGCSGQITIGRNVLIGPRVSMHAETHVHRSRNRPIKHQGVDRLPIAIGDDCWIGSDVVLLGGVTIGKGSVVGAGSVVTTSVPPGAVFAGVPARSINQ